MHLVTKTMKQCVELVKRNREKGAVEEKDKENEKETAEKNNHHAPESSHNVCAEELGKSPAEETGEQSQSHPRTASVSQANKQGQSSHQPVQSALQAQSQQHQPQQRLTSDAESQEVTRPRQNSINEELATQPAKVTVSIEGSNCSLCNEVFVSTFYSLVLSFVNLLHD